MAGRKEPVTFELKMGELSAVITKQLGLTPNSGSLLQRAPEPELRDADFAQLLSDGDFLRAARLLAEPDLYVVNRIGGGSMAPEEVRLYRKKSEGEDVAAVAVAPDGTCTLQLYADYRDYLSWWADNFAGKNEETMANYIPPTVSLEQFLIILHAVDCYRRVTFTNMLNYVYANTVYITGAEFARTMAASLKSGDIRWLLPAFTAILPGFARFNINIVPEDVGVLLEHNFFINARRAEDGEDVMVFGEAGRNMGVEFYRSWLLSSGFEINVAGPDGFTAAENIFIAPTALANHFARLLPQEDGKVLVNHQAYTREQLELKLAEIFAKTA